MSSATCPVPHLVCSRAVSETGFMTAHRTGLLWRPRTSSTRARVRSGGDNQVRGTTQGHPAAALHDLLPDRGLSGDGDFFGAKTVLLASASSKTALGVAFMLSRNRLRAR